MAMDTLESLFEQFEREAQSFDRQYGEWLSSSSASKPAPVLASASRQNQHTPAVSAPPAKPSSPVAKKPEIDSGTILREHQLRGLRRKYGSVNGTDRPVGGVAALPAAWSVHPLAELSSGELYLRAQSELSRGKVSDRAYAAVQLLHQKKREELFRREFLYTFTMAQQPTSLQLLKEAADALPGEASGLDACRYALYALQCMVRYLYNVTVYARQLREKGFRDRQQLLEEAQRRAQEQMEQARRDLANLHR